MDRRKTEDVLWLALQCAKDDRLSFINAYHDDRNEQCVIDAHKDIAAFNRLQKIFFGDAISKKEALLKDMNERAVVINAANIRKFFEENPELVIEENNVKKENN